MEMELNMEKEELSQKIRRYLTTALLILFVLQIVTLPFAAGYTFAGKDGKINQLVYKSNKLTWESSQGIDPVTGAAELGLFEVDPVTGKKMIYPGMEGSSTIRLLNPDKNYITYTAYVYRINSNESLPVTATLYAAKQEPIERTSLPDALKNVTVLDVLSEELDGRYMTDITVSWQWDYYKSDLQDRMDTLCAGEDDRSITLGVYIVAEDMGRRIIPETGDDSQIGMYTALMIVSGLLLILLLVDWRIQRQWEEICEES